ncbi:RNA polymerase sigma-70 factor (ECF subfamily) [Bradyrhizobium elkanii]|nr:MULTISPECIES: RNA polymerase sigma factor [Bradyrhizobium]MCS3931632.1 RNA polymerase sigma-70 factor (ECF subfamily) [Bradyrhizobium elkanii]MCS3972190.1 RNA polymerase sigma-70 factor (ECF subfamily) [Bradyrhizobium japonicum]
MISRNITPLSLDACYSITVRHITVVRPYYRPATNWGLSEVGRSMTIDSISSLRTLLLAEYVDFDRRLTRRLGSSDLASEALNETYLRLEGMRELGPVRSPKAYLFRIALNIAADRRRAEKRRLTVDEVDALLEIPDDRPDAARVIENRSEVNLLRHAIAELPERRRRVLMLSRIDGMPNREIAALLGVTVRTVETDLKQAVEHCADRLKRPVRTKFGFQRPASSYVHRYADREHPLTPGVCGKALDRDEAKPSGRSLGSLNP